ncbi:hypothetical protein [Castellaniella sp.]|uniref:hypothetical protein n=1 Tax=Castellaniella sp. TaxID=1955812 RepID=UPI002AFFB755|nr:hypothetical protein [Castellaniella sp.]
MSSRAKKNKKIDDEIDDLRARCTPEPLEKDVDFSLEKKALDELLDGVLRLRTYIEMRERRR